MKPAVEKLIQTLQTAAASNPPVKKPATQWAKECGVHHVTVYRHIRRLELDQLLCYPPVTATGTIPTRQPKMGRGLELRVGPRILRTAGIAGERVGYRIEPGKSITIHLIEKQDRP